MFWMLLWLFFSLVLITCAVLVRVAITRSLTGQSGGIPTHGISILNFPNPKSNPTLSAIIVIVLYPTVLVTFLIFNSYASTLKIIIKNPPSILCVGRLNAKLALTSGRGRTAGVGLGCNLGRIS
ncbi:hypothetical protein HOY80DRAFT_957123 [Tuber brumale]|nr:hypothetical protein HOY80DRAFT_957123 [Tuber brumale]